MPAPKPCLGYKSRGAAAAALADQGKSWPEIGRRIGVSGSTAAALATSHRRRDMHQQVSLHVDLMDELLPHAIRRQITAHEMARQILEAVVEGGLVAAVMDDGVA